MHCGWWNGGCRCNRKIEQRKINPVIRYCSVWPIGHALFPTSPNICRVRDNGSAGNKKADALSDTIIYSSHPGSCCQSRAKYVKNNFSQSIRVDLWLSDHSGRKCPQMGSDKRYAILLNRHFSLSDLNFVILQYSPR